MSEGAKEGSMYAGPASATMPGFFLPRRRQKTERRSEFVENAKPVGKGA